ncbi:hypothetical protein [Actinoplanes sp. NPDC051494]|uniref:hypothetical protein n=1 Tax=Actinoplanes sp. NPDC051494 TaxID=3363907 RepID=UPI0037BDF4C1
MSDKRFPVRQQHWWRARWVRPASAATLVVVAAIVVAGYVIRDNGRCADHIARTGDGECVGVSDGGFRFTFDDDEDTPGLDEVQQLIAKANADVGDAPWRGIAYVMPMPWNGQRVLGASDVVHQLYGAYAAQAQANDADNGQGTPKIKLFVANVGHAGASWETVATDLLERRDQDRITAVAGIGASLETTKRFAGRLSAAGLPMVGSTITADDLNGKQFPHLYRVGPNNLDEVKVLLAYMAEQRTSPAAPYLAVADDPEDAYVRQLETAFQTVVASGATVRPFTPNTLGWTEAVDSIAREVCRRPGKVTVYFAARSAEVRTFLIKVAAACTEKDKITVLTGDDATDLIDSTDQALLDALKDQEFALFMTGLAHPDEWGAEPTTGLTQLQRWITERTGGIDYRDGSAMMAFDAVSVTVRAIRSLAADAGDRSMNTMINGFNQITEGDVHCGASGPIAFHTEADSRGDTVNKAIPIITLAADASATFKQRRYPDGTGGSC